MDKLQSASTDKLLEWFRHYSREGNFEAMLKISNEIRRRKVGEPTHIIVGQRKTDKIRQNSMLNPAEMEKFIDRFTV